MGIKEDDLVRILDQFMDCDGYYMKPQVDENGRFSFFIAKDQAKFSDVNATFAFAKEAIGEKEEKELQLFTGKPRVECVVCADIPNLMDIMPDNE